MVGSPSENLKEFLTWCETMRKENPPPFPEDTRSYYERRIEMNRFHKDRIVVEAYEKKRGGYSWEFDRTEGLIEKVTDGIWGYGGDAVAVKINGEFYPSSTVRAKRR